MARTLGMNKTTDLSQTKLHGLKNRVEFLHPKQQSLNFILAVDCALFPGTELVFFTRILKIPSKELLLGSFCSGDMNTGRRAYVETALSWNHIGTSTLHDCFVEELCVLFSVYH